MLTSTTVYLYLVFAFIMALIPFLINARLVYLPHDSRPKTLLLTVLDLFLWGAGVVFVAQQEVWQCLLGAGLWVLAGLVAYFASGEMRAKSFFYRLMEWWVFYFVVGAVGFAIDRHYFNATHQSWQFYAITLCIFVTMAYPGFVYRHLWLGKQRHKV